MKKIAMIPVRLNSQRVPNKNLRLLNGKPMVAYIIETALATNTFDEVYLNSEAEIFKEIADQYGIKFYHRPAELASDRSTSEDFVYDFIKNVEGDVLYQLLATSPLITPMEITHFVHDMSLNALDTLVSIVNHRIASLYKKQPVNYGLTEKLKSSQTMVPVQTYATVLMAWRYENFKANMETHGCAYYGGDGRIGYYELKGLSAIDVDQEEDFILAEIAMQYRNESRQDQPRYYTSKKQKNEHSEVDVPEILRKDGVSLRDFEHENQPLFHVQQIIDKMGTNQSWSYRVVNTESNSATLISQMPGGGNRRHYHPDWNEWWYIIKGQWKWEIEGKKIIVKKGDIVFIEKNKWHQITAMGEESAIRLAVSRGDVPHIYTEDIENPCQ
ncbi:MAG: cupin domain-containing protein [Candidatus Omnitrophica bacterium]|nr:cupin domain-containing protein [Candidatus Omnitrophota bacterium]